MNKGRFAHRIENLSETKKKLLAQSLESHDLDASWVFEELPVPPRTPIEARLVEIWEQVLGLEDIGVEDDFFDLGGDSILSVRIVIKAREAGIRFSSRQLFENPTIARLADLVHIDETAGETPSSPDSAVARRSVPLAELTPEDFPEAELTREEVAQIRRLLDTRRSEPSDEPSARSFASAGGLSRMMALRAASF